MVHESEFFVRGYFMRIDYNNRQVRDTQVRQLLNTLHLLPTTHLLQVPTITVGNRPPGGGGGAAHRGMPGGPYVRLNRTCFNSSWNQGRYNETLLHEIGHIIDWAFLCMDYLRVKNRPAYQVLLSHPHSGRTQGPSEHYADAYADYHLGRSMSEPRRQALCASTAFGHVVV